MNSIGSKSKKLRKNEKNGRRRRKFWVSFFLRSSLSLHFLSVRLVIGWGDTRHVWQSAGPGCEVSLGGGYGAGEVSACGGVGEEQVVALILVRVPDGGFSQHRIDLCAEGDVTRHRYGKKEKRKDKSVLLLLLLLLLLRTFQSSNNLGLDGRHVLHIAEVVLEQIKEVRNELALQGLFDQGAPLGVVALVDLLQRLTHHLERPLVGLDGVHHRLYTLGSAHDLHSCCVSRQGMD